MPDDSLLVVAKAAMPRIKRRADIFSSPTRRALPAIERTVEQFILLDQARQAKQLAADRRRLKTNDKMARRVLKLQNGKLSIDGYEMEAQAAERRCREAEELVKRENR
jgi:hypothetical protein